MISVKLLNGSVIVEQEMPEICNLESDNIKFTISNFNDLKGSIVLKVENDGLKHTYNIKSKDFELPISILTSNITKIRFVITEGSDTRIYDAPIDRFRVRGIFNLKDSDKLVDLLALLYNKYIELEQKYNKLDSVVCEGDLLI